MAITTDMSPINNNDLSAMYERRAHTDRNNVYNPLYTNKLTDTQV